MELRRDNLVFNESSYKYVPMVDWWALISQTKMGSWCSFTSLKTFSKVAIQVLGPHYHFLTFIWRTTIPLSKVNMYIFTSWCSFRPESQQFDQLQLPAHPHTILMGPTSLYTSYIIDAYKLIMPITKHLFIIPNLLLILLGLFFFFNLLWSSNNFSYMYIVV